MKKLIAAIVAAYVILMGTNYLIHSIILMPDYDAIPLSHRDNAGIMHRMWEMAIGQFLLAVVFAYIYRRGVERKSWAMQGIRYGILMTFLIVIPNSLSEYMVYLIPHILAIKWMILGGIQMILMGLAVAAICKEPA
ncbi:MAG TPA: hypothetical protein VJR23_02110 [Candidatus Acidoferrales bacterium]|nr:hypothetical protein [Candidatus Acidoferrales bacterium]